MSGSIDVIHLDIPMTQPMVSAHTTLDRRPLTLVRAQLDGSVGWGECAALPGGSHDKFDAGDEYQRLVGNAGPLGVESVSPAGNAVACALVDLHLRRHDMAPSDYFGATVPVDAIGVVGLEEGDALIRRVQQLVDRGCRRVKIKIAPGLDAERVALVRENFAHMVVSLDANAGYVPDDPFFAHLAGLGVDYVEQPLAPARDRLLADLHRRTGTRIFVDESVASVSDVAALAATHAEVGFALKPDLLGGFVPAVSAASLVGNSERVVIGAMVNSAIGRSANAVIAGVLGSPMEVGLDGHWLTEMLTTEDFALDASGRVLPKRSVGLPPPVDEDALDRLTVERRCFDF